MGQKKVIAVGAALAIAAAALVAWLASSSQSTPEPAQPAAAAPAAPGEPACTPAAGAREDCALRDWYRTTYQQTEQLDPKPLAASVLLARRQSADGATNRDFAAFFDAEQGNEAALRCARTALLTYIATREPVADDARQSERLTTLVTLQGRYTTLPSPWESARFAVADGNAIFSGASGARPARELRELAADVTACA